MRVRVRYDLPDENGKSRRERASGFGDSVEQPPDFNVPAEGRYLWDWYFSLSDRVRRVRDGVCEPIPPSEFLAWCAASGTIVYPVEYGILTAMDDMFCEEMNKELRDYRTRTEEKQKQEIEAAKNKRG